jgi:hypothetical protein
MSRNGDVADDEPTEQPGIVRVCCTFIDQMDVPPLVDDIIQPLSRHAANRYAQEKVE